MSPVKVKSTWPWYVTPRTATDNSAFTPAGEGSDVLWGCYWSGSVGTVTIAMTGGGRSVLASFPAPSGGSFASPFFCFSPPFKTAPSGAYSTSRVPPYLQTGQSYTINISPAGGQIFYFENYGGYMMAAQQPYLQFRLWENPQLSSYVDSFPALREGETRPTSGLPLAGNGTNYTYNENRTPDFYLKTTAPPIYTPLTDDIGVEAKNFSATRRANDVNTWSVTLDFDARDRRAGELWEAAKNQSAFATMHITDPGDDMDVVDAYMSNDLFGGDIFTAGTLPAFADGISFPGVLDRGFSGPVLRVMPGRNRDRLEITIQGTCWGKIMQQTVHAASADLSVEDRTGAAGFQNLVRSIFSWNSEYAVDELDAADLGTDDAQGSHQWRTGLGEVGLPSGVAARTKTALGASGVIAAFHPLAIDRLGLNASTVFAVLEGQHSTLRSQQRLAEAAAGLLFDTNMRAAVWYAPLPNIRVWAPEDYVEATMSLDRPEATSWLTKHNDYRRDWLVYVIATDLIDVYGEIQTSNQSSAVRPLSFADEPVRVVPTGSTVVDRALTLAASDQSVLASIQAQDAGLALYEANRFSAMVGSYWEYPMRFGVDVGMGTPISLFLNDDISSDDNMPIRQAAFVWANNTWSQSFGLGSKADVIPKLRRDSVSVGGGR